MVNKRGQAAMEFLMTYGWAILVVLAAIGALAYFGVLSPDRFLPEKCTLPSGMACLDFTWDSTNGITTVIQNSAGFDMNGVGVSVNGTSCNAALAYVAGTSTSSNENGTTLTDGETKTYRMAALCTGLTGKFKGDVTVDYTNQQTSLDHSKLGEIILKTG